MGYPSKPTRAAEYSLWQRQIGLFWPNFLQIPHEKRRLSTVTEDLKAPGGESSGCEHLCCHGAGELCQPRQDGGSAASRRGQLGSEQQGRGEGAFIRPRESLKNQEVLKAAAFPAMHDACAVPATRSHKNIILRPQRGRVKRRWRPGLLTVSNAFPSSQRGGSQHSSVYSVSSFVRSCWCQHNRKLLLNSLLLNC